MYSVTYASTNRKVGPIPVTYSGAETCPDACPLKKKGCYAELGPGASHWKRLTNGTRGEEWEDFLLDVRKIPRGSLWRHNVAGDLPGVGDELDTYRLMQLVNANTGLRGFTYTHKPLATQHERDAVQVANRRGFTINLSADNLHEADELKALGIAPVVVVLPHDAPDRTTTPAGHEVIACPAETNDITCARCEACAHSGRKSIIGFRAHGAMKKKVSEIVRST